MAIQGSVAVSVSAAGNAQATLPSSDLQIIGVYAGTYYISIVTGPGTNAIIPINTPSRHIQPVQFKPGTNVINFYVPTACTVVFYYGTPLSGSKNLTDFNGVVNGASPTAAGSGTLTFNFPKGSGKLKATATLMSASTMTYTFNTSTGKSLTFQEFSGEFAGVDAISPVDVPLADTVTVSC
jgi:hypothetical protein